MAISEAKDGGASLADVGAHRLSTSPRIDSRLLPSSIGSGRLDFQIGCC